MSTHKTYFHDIEAWPHASRRMWIGYVVGFVLSLLLTAAAYFLAVYAQFPPLPTTTALILLLACIQFAVQMNLFLHIDFKPTSRMRLITLGFAVVIVGILVSGSVWIMASLNTRMMPSEEMMNQYMERQPGI
ncbi:MAG: cytochrome o ubiquinol oxidase subunit IV [Candidatus Paceibacterota bacterium]